MIKVKLLNGMAHPLHGAHQAGAVVLLADEMAEDLIEKGYAEAVDPMPEADEPEAEADPEKVEKETKLKQPKGKKETTKKDPAPVKDAEVQTEPEADEEVSADPEKKAE